ncbi:MAG: response regulator [Bacteroidales bacterium]
MKNAKQILIVDDSATARGYVKQILEEAQYEVSEAANGKEAMARIREAGLPDAMLLDLLMPEMDGFDVLESLQDQGISFPILVISADVQKQVEEEVLELGATLMMHKPLDTEDLLEKLKLMLA